MIGYRSIRFFLVLFTALCIAAPGHAQIFRAYLASDGNDANACTLLQPCRLLPAALAAVASGGQIWMLDSANYNTSTVSVAKSVTILATPGSVGSVVAVGGSAINIAAAGLVVTLRNLVIGPLPGAGGTSGITIGATSELSVEGCLIAGLPQHGIEAGGNAVLRVTDSTVRNNGLWGVSVASARAVIARSIIADNDNYGIGAHGPSAGLTEVDIAQSVISGNGFGVVALSSAASANITVTVADSQIVRNGSYGIIAQSASGAPVALTAKNNIVSHSSAGITAYGTGAKVYASGNTVSFTGWGLQAAVGGIFESAGNNDSRFNGPDTDGTITVVPKY
jgi:hypothetical protein